MQPIPFGFRQMQYLLAVAETGSTAAAARLANVSQPSVSHAIARLEAHFRQPLFLRLPGQGMQPTPFGRQKIEAFARLVGQGRIIFSDVADLAGELNLGVYSTLGPRYAPRLVRAFTQSHAEVRVRIIEDNIDGLTQGLRAGRIDLALVYDVGLPDDLTPIPLHSVPPYGLVPPDHPLAGETAVDLAQLARDPVILINLPHSRGYFVSLFQLVGVSPRIAAETGSIEMLRSMVANGLGVGLLATDLAHDLTYDGGRVVKLALRDTLPASRIVIVHSSDMMPTSAAAAFLKSCSQAAFSMSARPVAR